MGLVGVQYRRAIRAGMENQELTLFPDESGAQCLIGT